MGINICDIDTYNSLGETSQNFILRILEEAGDNGNFFDNINRFWYRIDPLFEESVIPEIEKDNVIKVLMQNFESIRSGFLSSIIGSQIPNSVSNASNEISAYFFSRTGRPYCQGISRLIMDNIVATILSKRESNERDNYINILRNVNYHFGHQHGDLLFYASKHGHEGLFMHLFQDNDDLGFYIKILIEPQNMHMHILQALFNLEIDINRTDAQGNTMLCIATMQGNLQAMDFLLNHGADINAVNSENTTPLCLAIAQGGDPVIELLINCEADVNITSTFYEDSPLGLAVANASLAINDFLAGQFQQLNCFFKIPDLLISHGADINAKNNQYGQTALHIAISNNCLAMARHLIDHGADVNITSTFYKESPLGLAVTKASLAINDFLAKQAQRGLPVSDEQLNVFFRIPDLLLACGADINSKNNQYGQTALHIAISNNCLAMARHLINCGANVWIQNARGTSSMIMLITHSIPAFQQLGENMLNNVSLERDNAPTVQRIR